MKDYDGINNFVDDGVSDYEEYEEEINEFTEEYDVGQPYYKEAYEYVDQNDKMSRILEELETIKYNLNYGVGVNDARLAVPKNGDFGHYYESSALPTGDETQKNTLQNSSGYGNSVFEKLERDRNEAMRNQTDTRIQDELLQLRQELTNQNQSIADISNRANDISEVLNKKEQNSEQQKTIEQELDKLRQDSYTANDKVKNNDDGIENQNKKDNAKNSADFAPSVEADKITQELLRLKEEFNNAVVFDEAILAANKDGGSAYDLKSQITRLESLKSQLDAMTQGIKTAISEVSDGTLRSLEDMNNISGNKKIYDLISAISEQITDMGNRLTAVFENASTEANDAKLLKELNDDIKDMSKKLDTISVEQLSSRLEKAAVAIQNIVSGALSNPTHQVALDNVGIGAISQNINLLKDELINTSNNQMQAMAQLIIEEITAFKSTAFSAPSGSDDTKVNDGLYNVLKEINKLNGEAAKHQEELLNAFAKKNEVQGASDFTTAIIDDIASIKTELKRLTEIASSNAGQDTQFADSTLQEINLKVEEVRNDLHNYAQRLPNAEVTEAMAKQIEILKDSVAYSIYRDNVQARDVADQMGYLIEQLGYIGEATTSQSATKVVIAHIAELRDDFVQRITVDASAFSAVSESLKALKNHIQEKAQENENDKEVLFEINTVKEELRRLAVGLANDKSTDVLGDQIKQLKNVISNSGQDNSLSELYAEISDIKSIVSNNTTKDISIQLKDLKQLISDMLGANSNKLKIDEKLILNEISGIKKELSAGTVSKEESRLLISELNKLKNELHENVIKKSSNKIGITELKEELTNLATTIKNNQSEQADNVAKKTSNKADLADAALSKSIAQEMVVRELKKQKLTENRDDLEEN